MAGNPAHGGDGGGAPAGRLFPAPDGGAGNAAGGAPPRSTRYDGAPRSKVIDAKTYAARRDAVQSIAKGGSVLLLGQLPASRNYRDNTYPFRQNSHVLYYCGVALPGLALVIGETADDDVLYGPPEDLDDIVWHGPHETLPELAAQAGIRRVRDIADLPGRIAAERAAKRPVHWLPPYRADAREWLASLVSLPASSVASSASADLARAVVGQRSVKSAEEIAEIEDALAVTKAMHLAAFATARPGRLEAEIAAAAVRVATAQDRVQAYTPIVTVHGEVLHNTTYHHRLAAGHLLLNDSGSESPLGYASDITRVAPVGGRFTARQREIYEVVLDGQLAAIAAIRPGVRYRDVHLLACRRMAAGLRALGLLRGDPDDAVQAGAHALFFPHGLGHLLGLDVHDLEDLGDLAGYPEGEARSPQFGLNFLRLAKPLEAGFVVTVEPGLYFIPALLDRFENEGRHRDFVDYERARAYRGLGGIRIEDDVLCTASGARVLGPPIPKTVAEVEAAMAGAA